jgi:hypothetical protein
MRRWVLPKMTRQNGTDYEGGKQIIDGGTVPTV